ncbi:hypothetical protein [Dinoroseobacter sp. S375]|uniref:hypothetical protein n=1 Tax=Dinoroseobacter sp. S375 TaxID=3415136 RepID=UPI003C7B5C32
MPFLSRSLFPAAAAFVLCLSGLPGDAAAQECQRKLNFLGANASDSRKLEALLICAEETRTDLDALQMRVSAVERSITGLERADGRLQTSLDGVDDKIARAVQASERRTSSALATEARTLRSEIREASGSEAGELRSLKMQVTAAERALGRITGRGWEEFGVAKRSIGRAQNNDKDYPIVVAATINVAESNRCHARIKVNGLTVAETKNNNSQWDKSCFVTATVPPGANYVLESAPHGGGRPRVSKWTELR